MLTIEVSETELFMDETNEFVIVKPTTIRLEHSLVSLSKWESIWKIPFLSLKVKTRQQTLDYVKCMTVSQNVDPMVYNALTNDHINAINEYINDNKTATTFNDRKRTPPSSEQITSELIYFWMAQYNVPMECQKWHLSRLLTLIRICSLKNAQPEKMPTSEIMARNRELNAARRKALRTRG